ncbi:MAG: zinc-binding dehydrogenase [Candidatus Methylomirabilales bacterium]
MRVAKVVAPGQIRLEDEPIPSPGPGEVLVRIKAVGVCGSDLQYYAHGRIGDLQFAAGHVLGHEAAGVVEALGPDTEGPAPGTPVLVDPAMPCGGCRYCAAGHPNLCRRLKFFGSPPTPGALCEYLTHPSHLVLPLPAGTTFPVGAVSEALGVAIHAVDLSHLRVGESAAVFGCGPIGLLIARAAQIGGASPVLASEPLEHRREAASLFGVSAALDPGRDDVVGAIRERTGGDGVGVAFEAAGSESATVQAVDAVRPGGTLVLVGYWKADQVTLPGIRAMRKGLTIRFVRRMKHTFPRALELMRQGLVNLPALISHEFPLSDVAEAFARAETRSPNFLKTVVTL